MLKVGRRAGFGLLLAAFVFSGACAAPRRWQVRDPDERMPDEQRAAPTPEWRPASPSPATEPMAAGGQGVGPDFLGWPRTDDQVLASIGGEELRKSQVLSYLLATQPNRVRAAVAVMLGNRVIAAEAERHGIGVAKGEIDGWWTQHCDHIRSRAMLDYGVGTTLERWVELTQGQSLSDYERSARDREHAARLLARVVRYRQLLEDRVELRILSLTSRTEAEDLRRQVESGASFEVLARQHSVHPSAEFGGLMSPVWRRALNPALEGPAFSLPEGGVSNIITVQDDLGVDRFQIIKVTRRWLGRTASYRELERDIVAELQTRPLTEDEYMMWQIEVNRMADVRKF